MKATILIIDDQVKVYTSLARNFKHFGYQTIHAKTGQEAIELFSQHPVHVVLLDIMLGEENGVDILKELLHLYEETPVIMITGHGSIDTAVQSIKLGAFDYVTKPLNFSKLVKIIENAVKVSNLSQENRHLKDRLLELSPHIITQNKRMLEICKKANS